jgi:hypothetical protein
MSPHRLRPFAAVALITTLLSAALVSACGSSSVVDPGASLQGRWTLRSVNGQPLPVRAPLWSSSGYGRGDGMLQSGFLDVTPASYLTSETMTDVHLTFGTTTDTDNSDFGTVGGVAASLIFHGKYGDLAGDG